MPSLPSTEGFPLWAQVLISIIFGVGALGVAFKGYFGRSATSEAAAAGHEPGRSTSTTSLVAGAIMDAGAMRHLSDAIARLDASVISLTTAVNEGTHYSRNEVDTQRELCARLRALCEELERQSRNGGWNHGRPD